MHQTQLVQEKSVKTVTVRTVFIIFILAFWKCHGQTYPFMNTSLTFEGRVKVGNYNIVGACDIARTAMVASYSQYSEFRIWLDNYITLDEMVFQMSHGGASNNGDYVIIHN